MTRSSNTRKTAALVLALGLIQGTLAATGPGTYMDYWHNKAEWSGAPKQGYHVKTETTGDGTYNQTIAKDADEGIAFINKDPADGVSGPYTVTDNLYCIPKGNYAEGYPAEELPKNVTTALQKFGAAAPETKDGVPLQKSGSDHEKVGYNTLAEENDYMLLLFGAAWCDNSCDFMSRLAKYYKLHKDPQHSCTSEAGQESCKRFDVVYFSCDESEDKFNASYKKMPWKSAPYEESDAEHGLRDQLEGLFPLRKTLPFLVVIDREGDVLTEEGVDALCGKHIKGKFPLADGGDLFDDYQKDKKDCPISEEAMIENLKSAVNKKVNELDEFTLRYYATKVADTDMDAMLSKDDDKVREYVCDQFNVYIHNITNADDYKVNGREKILELFARIEKEENYPENQVFKKGEHVKILKNFTSDSEYGRFEFLKAGPSNRPNTGEIKDVKQDGKYTDAIQVKCADNSMTKKWIKASNYKFIQKMDPKDGRRTQSGHL